MHKYLLMLLIMLLGATAFASQMNVVGELFTEGCGS
jgi:hypothetical protein